MSGHSKWSTIKRQKGVADNKRGQVFTKLANAIVLAAKSGGGADPTSNFKLRLAIDKARAANMPKDNIDRAISRASGADGREFEEVMYEAFVPGGGAVLIEAATDKKQRTVAEIKNLLEKNGGAMGGPGSVSYLFARSGEIVIEKKNLSTEDIVNLAMEANIDDFQEAEDSVIVYTTVENLQEAKNSLETMGLEIREAGIVFKPIAVLSIPEQDQQRAFDLLQKLEEHDDVQKIYTNVE